MNSKTIFTQTYNVNSINVDITKKLGLLGLLEILQDAASSHANILGFGYDEMTKRNIFWVLVQQKIKIKKMPCWNDTIRVKTWTKPFQGIYACREFELFVNDEKIAECSTNWMILNGKTRRPTKPDFLNDIINVRTDYSLSFSASKIVLPKTFDSHKLFTVYNSHLDMNNHVNNVKYSQFILNSIPIDFYKSHTFIEYEINFLQESFLNDCIKLNSKITQEKQNNNTFHLFFKGEKQAAEKPIFTAHIIAHLS